jgi:hypothetical protein
LRESPVQLQQHIFGRKRKKVFTAFVPFTDASESSSEFKFDSAVRTNGWELRTDPGILKRKEKTFKHNIE